MNSIRKMIPAIAMLVISILIATTASFAWFTMNNEVDATGLDVNIVSDETFLLISSTQSTAAGIQGEGGIAVNFGGVMNDLKPAAHNAITNYAGAAAVSNWYTAKGTSVSDSTMKTGTKKTLTSFDGYVLKKTLYFTVQKDYAATSNLQVTATRDNNASSLKILAVANNGSLVSSVSSTAATLFSGSISDTTVVTVDIYIYYDGDDSTVYNNNKANIGSASITLKFSSTDPNAED